MGKPKPRQPRNSASHDRTPTLAPTDNRLLVAALFAFVIASVVIVYHPVLNAQALAFDDSQYLVENRLVRNPSWDSAKRFLTEILEPSTVGGYYQPLTMISLMFDYAAGGRPDDLRAFHRTSLALHAINAGLVLLLLYLLFGKPWPAAIAALVFGLHPLTVEPIPWVGERKTLLAAFFALLSLIAYVRYTRKGGWKPFVACAAAYLLALMTKPTSTPLPLVMLLMDFWPLQRLSAHPGTRVGPASARVGPASSRSDLRVLQWAPCKRSLIEKLPLFALGAAFAVITVISQGRTAHLTMPTEHAPLRIPLLLCHNIIFYLVKIVCPIHLTAHYPLPEPLNMSADPMIFVGVIGTCILLPALLLSLRHTRALATGWLIFFVTLLPTTGIIGFTIVIASDKYAYLPAIGLLMILAWAIGLLADRITRLSRPRPALAASIIALAILLAAESVATRRQIARWRETENLYRYMIDRTPQSARLYTILGEILTDRGRDEEAILAHRHAIELRPNFPEALNNLGQLLAQQSDTSAGEACIRKSLAVWPSNPKALSNLGIILASRGDLKDAVAYFEQSLALDPKSSETTNNLANTLLQLGRVPEALPHYHRAIELDPNNLKAHFNLAIALERRRDFTGASDQYRQVIRLNPADQAAHQRLRELATRPASTGSRP